MVICAIMILLTLIMMVGHMLPYGEAYHTFMCILALILALLTLFRIYEKKRTLKWIGKWVWVINAIAVIVVAFLELGAMFPEGGIEFIEGVAATIAFILAISTIVDKINEKKAGGDEKPST